MSVPNEEYIIWKQVKKWAKGPFWSILYPIKIDTLNVNIPILTPLKLFKIWLDIQEHPTILNMLNMSKFIYWQCVIPVLHNISISTMGIYWVVILVITIMHAKNQCICGHFKVHTVRDRINDHTHEIRDITGVPKSI